MYGFGFGESSRGPAGALREARAYAGPTVARRSADYGDVACPINAKRKPRRGTGLSRFRFGEDAHEQNRGEKARRTQRGLNARVGRGFQAYADLRGKPRRGLSVQKHLQARSGNASALPGEKRGAAWKQMVVEAFSATPL